MGSDLDPVSLWERVEPLLRMVERPSRYIASEWNARGFAGDEYRAALIYPDTYELGMANQALRILYAILNGMDGVGAERAFVPWKDMSKAMRQAEVPLFTLESCVSVASCDLVGITLPHELTYSNVLEVLDLAGIPLMAVDRGTADPMVIAGGPCAFNPEPVAAFFDAILLGEGEEAVVEIVDTHRAAIARGESRAEILEALSSIDGVYVPSLYEVVDSTSLNSTVVSPIDSAQEVVRKRIIINMDAYATPFDPVVPYMDVVHDRVTVEILRGCTRGCRFCQAGMVYRPVRERKADAVVRDVMECLRCTGYEEVSLTSLSSADHSRIDEIARRLRHRLEGTGVTISLPSSRVDAFGVDLARLIGSGRKGGLTFAPEAGSQRLRDVINKNVSEEDLLNTVHSVFEAGWQRVKLYYMIGLPTETDEDLIAIGRSVRAVLETARKAVPKDKRGGVRVSVSVSTFVPKAHTPFQWEPQISLEEVRRRQEVIRSSVPRKGVDLSWHDPATSFLEGALARGGRELAAVVEEAWRSGAVFDAWTEEFDLVVWLAAFEQCDVDPVALASGTRIEGEALPWSHLSAGVSEAFLKVEAERARSGTPTVDCSFDECTGCGVCSSLGVDIDLDGVRRG